MAKSYYIPGVGHFTDTENGKKYYIPAAGHFSEATGAAPSGTVVIKLAGNGGLAGPGGLAGKSGGLSG